MDWGNPGDCGEYYYLLSFWGRNVYQRCLNYCRLQNLRKGGGYDAQVEADFL